QCCLVPRRLEPPALAPANPTLRCSAHRRKQIPSRHHPLLEALRGSRDLSSPAGLDAYRHPFFVSPLKSIGGSEGFEGPALSLPSGRCNRTGTSAARRLSQKGIGANRGAATRTRRTGGGGGLASSARAWVSPGVRVTCGRLRPVSCGLLVTARPW